MSDTNFKILQDEDLQVPIYKQEFATDVLIGLSQELKWLPTKYIYDKNGSKLFQKIMALPDYYLTRTEIELLENNKESISEIIGDEDFNLVELGAGDGQKSKILLNEFLSHNLKFNYVPIDISKSAIIELLENLDYEYSNLKIKGLVAEYFNGLRWLSGLDQSKNFVIFLGSSIGNFSSSQIQVFLYSLWDALNDGDYVLIGFDLKKNIEKMEKAYNDNDGITAEFNLNLLKRVNDELGGNFNIEQFQFYSAYDCVEGAIQSYLISKIEQSVFIEELDRLFSFKPWEPIHTESSYKFLVEDIERLAEKNRFEKIENFFDLNKYFVDSLWRVKKD